ncbi:TonB-dependent receptor [Sphingomonas sp. R-74633]|uniref:TonB-dependent receptor n=1 Tax=Sphingomonas sp. R-74633 TaxID=2751188 RepID=UPI0015D4424E|nr:TonB-dependent receptor [Sphingomonas sp. R-74633]NYT42161.1 TonB-dependent receptor [Sphingomonas sp. R-74633]
MRKHDSIQHVGKNARFRTGALRAGVSAAALACLSIAAPAWAQDTQTPPAADAQTPEDTIVVQGYRQSLQSAQTLKKNSDVIVDSVTAEDIGALPDRSVTETLQRIPGVSINRFAAGVDPDHFSVEGSGVVVRGLTYVRSEFNGREAFTANNGRALSFADVPSEMMGGVDVFKSPSADRIEGGIAGVVNLRTRKPFDNKKGLVVAGSLEANYGDFEKKWTPTGSLMISDRWETGIGEFGLLGNFSYSQLKSQSDRFQVSSFRIRNLYSDGDVVDNGTGATVSKQVYFPRGAVMGRQEFNRERYGYAAAAQFRSNDGSVEAVAQFLRSDARQAWTERTIEIATDNVSSNGDSRAAAGTTLNFDSDGMFASGTITGPTGWRGDQNTGAARTPMLGLQSNNIRRDQEQRLVTDDYGFNLKWNASERLGVTFDYQHVKSTTHLLDNTLWNSTYQNASIKLNGSDFPTVAFLPPQVCNGPSANSQNPPGTTYDCNTAQAVGGSMNPSYYGAGHNSFTDPYNTFPRAAMDHVEQSDGNSDAFRLDLDYALPEGSFLKSIQGGVRYADRDQVSRFSRYNWGVLSEQWGNNGPIWLTTPVNGNNASRTDGAVTNSNSAYYFDNFFRGQVTNPLGGQGRLYYNGDTVGDYAQMALYASSIASEWQGTTTCGSRTINAGWNPLAQRCGVVAGTPFLPDEINPIRERNYAAYLMTKIDTHLGGLHLTGNVGVRYTRTKRQSDGYNSFTNTTAFPTDATCSTPVVPPATLSPFCSFSITDRNNARAFVNGALTPVSTKLDYDYWLPSVNFKLEVGGGLQFRAAYFKGVAPPQTGFIRNYTQANLSVVQNTDASGTLIPNSFRFQGVTTAGNPTLMPTKADNFDLTAEWYFSRVGSFTVSAFYKVLDGVVTNDTRRVDLTNNGQTYPIVITTPINATEKGKIKGFEVAYQQTFDFLPGPLKGLGLQANYTFVDSSGVPQSTLSETDPDVAAGRVSTVDTSTLPLQGLSKHTVNITPFFDYGPISLRASYSWRSDFVLTVRDVITPFDPIINKATGQLDASIFFAVTPQIKLGIQGSNLTNEITRTTAVISKIGGGNIEVPRGWYMNDRRFAAIARFNF